MNKKSSFHNDFQGKDFFLQADFNIPIINILWQLLAGYRFTNDEEHEEGLKAVESVTELFAQGMANSFLPFKLQKVKFFMNKNMFKKIVLLDDSQHIWIQKKS